jgi:hypothetical protein
MTLRSRSGFCHAAAMRARQHSTPTPMRRAPGLARAAFAALGIGFAAESAPAADAPGAVLRRYLDARWKGDIAAAEALWNPTDLRRSQAFGNRSPGLEARFDDNLLWSAETRATAAAHRPVVADSSIDANGASFGVVVRTAAGTDTLRYALRSVAGQWRVGAPFDLVTRAWTSREGRYVRLHVARLRDINADAIAALDNDIERMLQRLGAPEQVRLRLERLKIEYALCRDANDVRALCGSMPPGYRLAGERVVSRSNSDLNAVARVVVHLTAKDVPPRAVPLLEEGTAAALGGWRDWSGNVVSRRGAALAAGGGAAVEAVLDPAGFAALPADQATPLAAAWCTALLQALGPQRFVALYAQLSTAAAPERAFDAAAVRAHIETAAGKRGAALVEWVRAQATAAAAPLRPGCSPVPVETRVQAPILRWRDTTERWALEAYVTGDDYTFVLQPFKGTMPEWVLALNDSLARKRGETVPARPLRPRPPGDPPQLAITLKPRLYSEPEAYESALFRRHFRHRVYTGELVGIFIGLDSVRMWDYRRQVLLAAVAPEIAAADAEALYDEPAGRVCFRIRRDMLAGPLEEYLGGVVPYTGE